MKSRVPHQQLVEIYNVLDDVMNKRVAPMGAPGSHERHFVHDVIQNIVDFHQLLMRDQWFICVDSTLSVSTLKESHLSQEMKRDPGIHI